VSKFGDIAKAAFDVLTPEGKTERLTFRKFKGSALAKAAETFSPVSPRDVETIVLKVNPEEQGYAEPKITQKIQTSAPGRFIVFDWGTDLLQITISGNTGNLIPGIIQSGFDPLKGMVEDIADIIAPSGSKDIARRNEFFGGVTPYAQNVLLRSLNYHELLEMSPKFRIFNSLRRLYRTFDADRDVLTLEVGNEVHRGYFLDFSFTQTAISPWNWKYSMVFVSLKDLSEAIRKDDEDYADNEFVDRSV
jgi:hypothetical protein